MIVVYGRPQHAIPSASLHPLKGQGGRAHHPSSSVFCGLPRIPPLRFFALPPISRSAGSQGFPPIFRGPAHFPSFRVSPLFIGVPPTFRVSGFPNYFSGSCPLSEFQGFPHYFGCDAHFRRGLAVSQGLAVLQGLAVSQGLAFTQGLSVTQSLSVTRPRSVRHPTPRSVCHPT